MASLWKKDGDQFTYENGHRSEVMNTVISTRDENYLAEINIYPTISSGTYQVDIPQHLLGEVRFSLLDQSGKVLDDINFQPQTSASVLDMTQVPAGQYFLSARLRSSVRTTSLVKH